MKRNLIGMALLVTLAVWITLGLLVPASADEDERHETKRRRPPVAQQVKPPAKPLPPANAGEAPVAKGPVTTPANPVYLEQCGACHFAYQPNLLPWGSWKKILESLEDHFGEVLPLEPETVDEIGAYLESNAAERSNAKHSGRILNSLNGATPLRITEVPYILHKHRKIGADVLQRSAIGSLSNCIACHRSADKGSYDDDSVSIPK
jgi:mono/diheme cytochrome c family protein